MKKEVKKKNSKSFFKNDEQDESELKKSSIGDFASFKFLIICARPYWSKLIIALIITYCGTSLGVGTAYALGHFIQNGLIAKNLEVSYSMSILIILLEALAVLLTWLGRKLTSKYSSYTILEVRKKLFDKLSVLPMTYFDHQPQGRVVTRLTHDVEGIEQFFTSSMSGLFVTFFAVINTVIAMLTTNFVLGFLIILAMIPALFLTFYTKKRVRNLNRAMSKTNSATSAKLSEFLDGLEVIRSFGIEKWSIREYYKKIQDNLIANIDANKYLSYLRPIILMFCIFPLLALIFFGGQKVLDGSMSVALFMAFVRLCEKFTNPIMRLAREIHIIQQAFTSAERVATFLQERDEDFFLGQNPKNTTIDEGSIEFKSVWMKYESDWILKDISFDIMNGQTIGMVGRTGCGKTTTVSLLSRLYPFQKGEIRIGNRNILEIDRHELRNKIGFVSQDVILFKGSLFENLAMGDIYTNNHIEIACKQTGLSEILRNNQMNLETKIQEGGTNLSVGERQLISLTRILLKNPLILILDEATANIDPYYEKIIQDAIAVIMKDRTCLMIAHRLSTLQKCDKILVFDQGSIVEEGSIDQLIKNRGHYYNLQGALLPKLGK